MPNCPQYYSLQPSAVCQAIEQTGAPRRHPQGTLNFHSINVGCMDSNEMEYLLSTFKSKCINFGHCAVGGDNRLHKGHFIHHSPPFGAKAKHVNPIFTQQTVGSVSSYISILGISNFRDYFNRSRLVPTKRKRLLGRRVGFPHYPATVQDPASSMFHRQCCVLCRRKRLDFILHKRSGCLLLAFSKFLEPDRRLSLISLAPVNHDLIMTT